MTDPSERSRQHRRQVFQAAGIVGGAFVISRLLGLGRQIVIASLYGAISVEATAYETASRIPETIFFVIAGGALGSAFIPTFTGYFTREDAPGGWRLFSAVTSLVTVVTTLVCLAAFFFAPQIVTFFLADLIVEAPALAGLTVPLLRVLLLSPIIFGVSGVAMAALNARQHFLMPAIAPIIYNIGIILGAVLFAPDVMGLGYGAVAGAVGHLGVQLPALRRQEALFRPRLTLRDPGVTQVLRLMAPRVLGLSFSQINHLITTFLAQAMALGSIPALGTAWRIMVMPQGILGQAMGIAAFPTLAALAARAAWPELRRILAESLRSILFLGIPATALLATLRRPLIELLFERGRFGPEDTALVAAALLYYAFGLVALAALEVIARAFYALEDTVTPVVAGGLQLAVMGALGWWASFTLFPRLGQPALGGLALAVTVSNLAEVGLLLWLLRRKIGRIDGRFLWAGAWRMSVAGGLAMGAAAAAVSALASAAPLTQLITGAFGGGGLYLLACRVLGVAELGQTTRLLARLARRRRR